LRPLSRPRWRQCPTASFAFYVIAREKQRKCFLGLRQTALLSAEGKKKGS
jgi:hypothetical protein